MVVVSYANSNASNQPVVKIRQRAMVVVSYANSNASNQPVVKS